MSKIKKSSELTLKDKLSRLSFTQECILIAHSECRVKKRFGSVLPSFLESGH